MGLALVTVVAVGFLELSFFLAEVSDFPVGNGKIPAGGYKTELLVWGRNPRLTLN